MIRTWKYNDGGRLAAGYKGMARDCVVRAIAIASDKPYQEVYEGLRNANKLYATTHRDRTAKKLLKQGYSPRNGVFKEVYREYLRSIGFTWMPLMKIGSGCTTHLNAKELPIGTIILRVSKHIVTMIDGVLQDNHNPSRQGMRCVYGYFTNNI